MQRKPFDPSKEMSATLGWVKRVLLPKWYWKISLMLCVILLFTVWKIIRQKMRNHQRHLERQKKQKQCRSTPEDETIFVSIASYRDPECPQTVFDCLEQAACPLRITVGVCQQNYDIDVDTLTGYKRLAEKSGTGNYADRIKLLSLDAGQAQGPMYARHVIEQQLYRGEKYYLIIDSHTTFCPDWDVKAIAMLQQCPPRSILTMYPENYHQRSRWKEKPRPPGYLCLKKFNDESGLPELEGPVCHHCPNQPQPSLFWAGCFAFSLGQVIREVPFDPHCPYVFLGEEISMAARLFTHGWNLFTPTCMLVQHMWTRRRPTFWEQFTGKSKLHQHRQLLEQHGYRRLRHLFLLEALEKEDPPLGKYGLGHARTLAQYEQYCGVQFLFQKALPRAYLGVTAQPEVDEVMTKFGSMQAYQQKLRAD